MTETQEYLTAEEVATRLRIQPDTVRDWVRRGLLPVVRLTPKVVRFEWSAVVQAMTERQAVTQ